MSGPKDQSDHDKEIRDAAITDATVLEYIEAHSKPNGSKWKSFFHSNLFVALLLWVLSQMVLMGGFFVSGMMRTNQETTKLSEWRGGVDTTLHRMDDQGTIHSHYEVEQANKAIAKMELRVDKLEELTRHMEVVEYEHRRLTEDVEKLKNAQKK